MLKKHIKKKKAVHTSSTEQRCTLIQLEDVASASSSCGIECAIRSEALGPLIPWGTCLAGMCRDVYHCVPPPPPPLANRCVGADGAAGPGVFGAYYRGAFPTHRTPTLADPPSALPSFPFAPCYPACLQCLPPSFTTQTHLSLLACFATSTFGVLQQGPQKGMITSQNFSELEAS